MSRLHHSLKEKIERTVQRRGPLLVGTTLGGKWKLLESLGTGATSETFRAEVFKAEEGRTGRTTTAAIKVYKGWVLERPDEVDRLLREYKVMKSIHHPNLMQLKELEVDENAKVVYMVMEFLNGKTLTDFIKSFSRKLPYDVILKITTQLCLATNALHKSGIVHRDIKPDNIMIQGTTGDPFVKLMDFGVIGTLSEIPITSIGDFLGTLRYAPPEWVLHETGEIMDNRVDIYSVGATLFEMLTGTRPYSDVGRNKSAITEAVVNENLFSRSFPLVPELEYHEQNEFLQCVGAWLTAKNLHDRPTKMTEVIAVLERRFRSHWWKARVRQSEENFVWGVLERAKRERDEWPLANDSLMKSLLHDARLIQNKGLKLKIGALVGDMLESAISQLGMESGIDNAKRVYAKIQSQLQELDGTKAPSAA